MQEISFATENIIIINMFYNWFLKLNFSSTINIELTKKLRNLKHENQEVWILSIPHHRSSDS